MFFISCFGWESFEDNFSSLVNNNNPLQLGGATWIPRYFTGRIAAFQMYNKELTAAQIKQNFNQERSRFGV